ncbi:ArsA family ATPase [Candidatus Bathyarchaeota archaeon]|nr:ArsA family ATPase [Candidatus Bathyarchaeota archaeon]
MFTGGKGGVGKTIAAAGIAYHFASKGEKVLLASLNPVHSLSSLFQQDLTGGVVKPVKGAKNLYAIEVDITERKEKYKAQLAEKLRMFLKWADISMKADEFVDIASTNPAFEESAMFDETMEIMLNKAEEYDRIVFDTAAVANAVRLLGLSKIYGLWLSRMIKSRKEALSLRVKLSFRKEKVQEEVKKDPLIADLLEMNERIKKAKEIFNDPERTAFFFVTLPLALPIAVVKRFIGMVQGFNIPTGGVIVNQVIPEELVKRKKVSEYLTNKFKEQEGYLKIIKRDLWPMVRAIIPLYETEILGVDMVAKVAEDLASWKP